MKTKSVENFTVIYKQYVGMDEIALQKCIAVMKKNKNCGVCAPSIFRRDNMVHNYRNFPTVTDLVIKNIGFLRKAYTSRMRRFLMWDIRLDALSEVDFVTSDFMCVRTDLLKQFGFDRIEENFFDLKLCIFVWSQNFSVIFDPRIKVNAKNKTETKGFALKIKMLASAVWMKLSMWSLFENTKYPSKGYQTRREMVMQAHRINSRSFLSGVGSNFQKNNSVVQVYEGFVEGQIKYKQPLVFHYDGVLAVIKNTKGQFGLIKIWRHSPLKHNVPNLFPVFPENTDLGIYSYECVRGGGEKHDDNLETGILRELKEEINLGSDDIKSIRRMSRVIGNTAWDVAAMHCFEVVVNDKFHAKLQESESISDFVFVDKTELREMLKSNKISCGLSRAALLESILDDE